MADNDQQLVDTLNEIRGEARALHRRLETALAGRRAEPDQRFVTAMRSQASEIAGLGQLIGSKASAFEQGLPASPET
jgi:hypothetical protein